MKSRSFAVLGMTGKPRSFAVLGMTGKPRSFALLRTTTGAVILKAAGLKNPG